MKARKIVTAGLLLFVAASVVALGIREWDSERGVANSEAEANARPAASTRGPGDASPTNKVIAYYFHGNTRCVTCNTIEAYSHQALQRGFAEHLNDGRIEWRVVNYQQPENAHFQKDFQLIAPSLVLVSMHDGKQTGWKDLPDVWTFIDDKDAFLEYVQRELRAFLKVN